MMRKLESINPGSYPSVDKNWFYFIEQSYLTSQIHNVIILSSPRLLRGLKKTIPIKCLLFFEYTKHLIDSFIATYLTS